MNLPLKKLGDVAQILNGYAFKSSGYVDQGIRIIRITNVQKGKIQDINPQYFPSSSINEISNYLLNDGDLLISLTGNVGRVGIITKEFLPAALNQRVGCIRVRNNEDINIEYLYQYMNTDSFEKLCINNSNGVAQLNLSTKWLESHQIPLPPLEDQIHIANVLSRAEALIAKRKESLALLDAYLKSVFLEMFGDPVRNEKGWERVTIRDLVSEVKYGTSKSAGGGKYKYLRMNNITSEGYWDFTNLKTISIKDAEKEKYSLKKNDLVFNRTNSKELVGKTAVYNSDEEVIIAGYLIRIRTNSQANPYFIWGYLNSKAGKLRLFNLCRNIVGMANINAQELQDIPILFPPLTLQNQFAAVVEKVEALKETYQKSLVELENLYGSLSQRAFRGELGENQSL
ncbi:MAG: restriction endonuclease subunit S [Leptospira sp.]|uniref:restriction endonuclease subunit S n=1 Tax=Leptospira sp. TaxID=178 RepID=UPI0025C58283|nr:restriction endonuclease subunit S [Leptospira sp.]MBL0953135.1 restriction endonuclease subunit S [Leptospira sp.]